MRASDSARDRTAALLRRRCSEGYLSLDTFERRVEQVYRARTTHQLAGLTADLPAVGVVGRLRRRRLAPSLDAGPAALRIPLDLVPERPLILGRGSRCDVVLDHDTVSRRHAMIARAGDGWELSDLGSSNGTWLDGRRVGGGVPVDRGDQLLLGGCSIVLL